MPTNRREAQLLIDNVSRHTLLGNSRVIGRSRSTVQSWQRKARALLDMPADAETENEGPLEFPEFPEDDIPVDEIIGIMRRRNSQRIKSKNARKWFEVKVKQDGPIALMIFGDPHIDDNYCNWDALYRHVEIAASHPRIFGMNIGDSHNNWVGRLMRLYADQDSSRKTAYKLVKWLMFDSGVKWMLWLLGNHDSFTEGAARIQDMGTTICPVEDWRAKFRLTFPNGREVLIDAAHDHKGSSMYNELHAQQKVVKMERTPHIAVAGHRHYPAIAEIWNPADYHVPKSWLCRVGSYKWCDTYALHNGFHDYQAAPSIMAIIDPDAENDADLVFVTSDLERGVRELNALCVLRGAEIKREFKRRHDLNRRVLV